MQAVLENEELVVTVNHFGAELSSIVKKETGTEYMWNADERFWKRSAPVLFPFVGSLKNKEFRYEDKAYPMGQHGFARDMDFSLVSNTGTECWFSLSSDESTYEKYPFAFTLEIGYRLSGNCLKVIWRVVNEDEKPMYFSIGGHPAFMCPLNREGKQTDYFIEFDTDKDLVYSTLSGNGLVEKTDNLLKTNGGKMQVTEHLFDADALVVEGGQAHRVSLCGLEGKPYLTVSFDAPLFGLWSPAKKNAPFICIEPWYGRCDSEEFSGTLQEREYGHRLEIGENAEFSFDIEIV
ncbi:MAG: aldose 1-epimerase family protein [Bacteroidales bacterium]|nr:aldose 1-epimerase family protein [Clostridium sp.]MCM1204035.1 aldose 1-epimerase family protein [Bacteroidales bacterium]